MSTGGVIGPFFFENVERATVTVNVDRYILSFEVNHMNDEWFQHVGATCHTPNITIDLWVTVIQIRIICRTGSYIAVYKYFFIFSLLRNWQKLSK